MVAREGAEVKVGKKAAFHSRAQLIPYGRSASSEGGEGVREKGGEKRDHQKKNTIES